MKRSLSLLMLALFLLGAPLYCSPTAQAQGVIWDERLSEIGVTLSPAQDTSAGYWQLISARYEDVDESGLNHNIYSRLYDEQGNMIAGAPWHVAWPDGNIAIYTKAPPEWADFPIFACYDPARGPGPYYAYAGDDITKSEVVRGMGLAQCQHVNFRLEWAYQSSPFCAACIPQSYLPIAIR